MKWLLGTYTGRFNRRHKLFGRLFSGRYKSLVVDGRGTGYLKAGDDDDLEMGGGAPGHGELEQRLESAGRGAKESSMKGESTQSENRPLYGTVLAADHRRFERGSRPLSSRGNSETMSHENLREDLPERPTAPIL